MRVPAIYTRESIRASSLAIDLAFYIDRDGMSWIAVDEKEVIWYERL